MQKNSKISDLNIETFTLEQYYLSLDKFGLSKTWSKILKMISGKKISVLASNNLLNFDNLGELYEIGLAHTNKIDKKDLGKYFTPKDVSSLMAELLLENKIKKIADVACGTGNLIIEVLTQVKTSNLFDVIKFIKDGNLYLYELDALALKICLKKIEILLEENLSNYINVVKGDFLNKNITLAENASVITNPPYSVIKQYKNVWKKDDVLIQAKDLYAGFISKILDKCEHAIIVSPQSYLTSEKFSLLRTKMNSDFSGEIFSFDNVPGTLFNGKKHGIFNTNGANGVRASITNIRKDSEKGFSLTHLIRFKTAQRDIVINKSFLRSKLGQTFQSLDMPIKSFKELEPMVYGIIPEKKYLSDLIEMDPKLQKSNFKLYVSTSARYFTIASKMKLDRNGYFIVYAKNEESFDLLYSLINSSYVYMWWRFMDGGILFAKRHLLTTPYNWELFNKIKKIDDIIEEMIAQEPNYTTYKKNAGKNQESIKFPIEYRQKINNVFFPKYAEYLELVHNNYEVSNDK